MKPLQHAKISAKKHGGKWEDYIDIHEFFDQTKAQVPDMRHRAILHNSMGIFICAQVFGEVRVNSAGREYSVRDIGEDHVLEDLGTIPTLVEVINCIDTKHLKWLGGLPRNKRTLVTRVPKEKPVIPATEEITTKPPVMIPCGECGMESPENVQEPFRPHKEECPVLARADESVKDLDLTKILEGIKAGVHHHHHHHHPSRNMVLDGSARRNRSSLID